MALPRKKFLVVCQHYWPESFRINDITDFLVEKKCDVEVLCGLPNYPSGTFTKGYSYFHPRVQEHNGVHVRRAFEIPRGNNSNLRIFVNYISFPIASLFHIPRLLFKRYDKILLYQLSPVMMSIAGIIVGKINHIETTMYVLDLWPENLFSVLPIKNEFVNKLVTKISHWHYRHVDKLVVLSYKMKNRLVEVTGISEDKITVLPQACEKFYEQDIEDKKLKSQYKKGFNILFAGNISPAQSFETILAAAKMLKKQGLDDINWIIVGDGMSRKWLEAEVKKAKLQDNFHFEGSKPPTDIPRYTAISDLLIGCLVKSEFLEATVPAKVMSYIAAGRPMVLAMDGEVQDLINKTIKNGYASPTEDAAALAANIKKIHDMSPQERTTMGRRGRAYHMKHFERNIILSKLYDFMLR